MEKIRCFIAFPIPETLQRNLEKVQKVIGVGQEKNLRPVNPKGMHLTLSFLGEISESDVYKAGHAMEAACRGRGRVELTCQGLGVFPDDKKPRVLWVGLQGQLDALFSLHGALAHELKGQGFELELRPFMPHLTLFRIKSPKQLGALRKKMAQENQSEFGNIRCDTLTLYKSDLQPSGAVYTKLKMVALDG